MSKGFLNFLQLKFPTYRNSSQLSTLVNNFKPRAYDVIRGTVVMVVVVVLLVAFSHVIVVQFFKYLKYS